MAKKTVSLATVAARMNRIVSAYYDQKPPPDTTTTKKHLDTDEDTDSGFGGNKMNLGSDDSSSNDSGLEKVEYSTKTGLEERTDILNYAATLPPKTQTTQSENTSNSAMVFRSNVAMNTRSKRNTKRIDDDEDDLQPKRKLRKRPLFKKPVPTSPIPNPFTSSESDTMDETMSESDNESLSKKRTHKSPFRKLRDSITRKKVKKSK